MKTIFNKYKKIIYIIILLIVVIISGLYIYLFYIKEDKVAVITYHNILDTIEDKDTVDISLKKFEKEIKWLHDNNFHSLTLEEMYNWKNNNQKIPRKSVLITFDDGWKSTYEKALPILEKYKMNAVVFIIWYNSDRSTELNNGIYMTKDDIKDVLTNHKSLEIASHSYQLHDKETADSKDYDIYNKDMQLVTASYSKSEYYAYPFGHRNEEYIKSLKDNNYKLAFTFGPYDFAKKSDNNYEIPRMGVFESTNDLKLKIKLLIEE